MAGLSLTQQLVNLGKHDDFKLHYHFRLLLLTVRVLTLLLSSFRNVFNLFIDFVFFIFLF